ncbi:MAG: PadR family transcriptional regulator [Streptosporangiaceae bacterium]
MTLQMQAVLRVLLDDLSAGHYGLEISRASGLPSGSLYPMLARLEQAGWVTSDWEDIDQSKAGRPRRRYYSLTADGAVWADQALVKTLRQLSPASGATARKLGWAGGQ